MNTRIEKYLDRIRFGDTLRPDLATLQRLHYAHMLTVPFENLDIHRGKEICLEESLLFTKIVECQRGGFCYELNGLFAALLTDIGFRVHMVSAQVYKDDGTTGPPFDHMALVVSIDKEFYLVDVGFGDSFTEPLLLSSSKDQPQNQGTYRVCRNGLDFTVAINRKYAERPIKPLFKFMLIPRHLSDFAEMCRFHQSSEHSHFTHKEICSRATPTGRITISGNKLIETDNERRHVTELRTAEHRTLALSERFGIIL